MKSMYFINYFSVTGGLNTLSSAFFCALLLARKREPWTIPEIGFCGCVGGWSFFFMLWHMTSNPNTALVLNRLMMIPAVILPSCFFHYSASLTGNRDRYSKIIIGSYILSLLHVLTLPTKYFVAGLAPVITRFWPVAGIFYTTHVIMFGILLSLSTWVLWKTSSETTGMFREKINYSLLASLIGFSGGTMNYIPCYGIPIPPYGNILVSIYFCIVMYILFSHRISDLNFLFRNILVRSAFTIFIGLPVLLLLWLLQTNSQRILLILGTIFVTPFFFRHLEERLEGFVDLWKPFRGRYLPYREAQQSLSVLSDCRNVDEWVRCLTVAAKHLTGAKSVGVFFQEEDLNAYLIKYGHGLTQAESIMLSLPFSRPLVRHFESVHEIINLDSLDDVFTDETIRSQVREDMEFIRAELCAPLYIQNVLKAILVLGNKEFGRIYNDLDLSYVDRLARQGEHVLYALLHGADKERLTVAWAHDLRRPFSAKGSFARLSELARGEMGPVNETMKNVLSTAISDRDFVAYHLNSIIDPTNQDHFNISAGSMAAVYHNTLKKYKPIMDDQGINLVVHVPDESTQAMRDPHVIEHRVISNFVENAVRYTPPKGTVEVGYQLSDGKFIGFVRDTGPGMKPEDLASLFKPGVQLNGGPRGLAGLGLFSAKSVIEAHHGKVWVESQWGQGATFYFQLPLAAKTVKEANQC